MLANGDVLVVAGDIDTTIGVNTLPQVFELATGQWRSLSSALLGLPLYPWMHLAPNGKVFNAGPNAQSRYLDTVAPTGEWSSVATRYRSDGSVDSLRDYGSSVLYEDGKVLVMGGGDPPTNVALTIDLGQPTPTWEPAGAMAFPRRQLNATLLPDGTVFVTGGSGAPGFNTLAGAVYDTELWDPVTRSWSAMVPQARPRLYHSTALLLPDGRVLSAGGDYTGTTGQNVAEQNLQVYSPPYLFRGPRPTISAAPSRVTHGQTFQVDSPDAATITQVTWLRLAAVTHAFNQDQRINRLAFVPPAGGGSALAVTAPSDPNLAPPGYYMLFLLRDGVPSMARIVRLDTGAVPAPTLAALSPGSAAAGSAGFELAVTGGNFVEPAAAPGGSVVRWNGAARPTRFVSGTELRADISAGDLAVAGTVPVTVANPGGTVSEAQTFTVQPRVTLTVTKSGTGTGTVTSTPAGIACGSDCSEAYARGTSVTLTATPAAGSAFQGWSGGGCRGMGPCTVLLNADATVTAKFRGR